MSDIMSDDFEIFNNESGYKNSLIVSTVLKTVFYSFNSSKMPAHKIKEHAEEMAAQLKEKFQGMKIIVLSDCDISII